MGFRGLMMFALDAFVLPDSLESVATNLAATTLKAAEPKKSSVFQNRFNIDDDIDLIPDDNPAAVHCVLPLTLKS